MKGLVPWIFKQIYMIEDNFRSKMVQNHFDTMFKRYLFLKIKTVHLKDTIYYSIFYSILWCHSDKINDNSLKINYLLFNDVAFFQKCIMQGIRYSLYEYEFLICPCTQQFLL